MTQLFCHGSVTVARGFNLAYLPVCRFFLQFSFFSSTRNDHNHLLCVKVIKLKRARALKTNLQNIHSHTHTRVIHRTLVTRLIIAGLILWKRYLQFRTSQKVTVHVSEAPLKPNQKKKTILSSDSVSLRKKQLDLK